MTTEYHDDTNDDSRAFWSKESSSGSLLFSSRSRWRDWLLPALTAVVILALIIALGASNTKTGNHLWSVEQSVSNLTAVVQKLTTSLQHAKDAAQDVNRLQFAVENNKDQLTSVTEALEHLSVLDSLSRTVAALKCSIKRITTNSTVDLGCCPLDWDLLGSSCYFFSKDALTWDDARDRCSGQEAHLAILRTLEEWSFVTRMTVPVFYWIGLTDERTGKWEWVNQTPYVMNRRHWKPNQPDNWDGDGLNSTEDCAHLHSDGRLNDLHCTTHLRYVCQKHSQRT
ncbi:C-type lectin domain family 10 member A [Diretmus argenteus]